jgi:hypothetical protein
MMQQSDNYAEWQQLTKLRDGTSLAQSRLLGEGMDTWVDHWWGDSIPFTSSHNADALLVSNATVVLANISTCSLHAPKLSHAPPPCHVHLLTGSPA